jgi:DinB superfamily
MRYKIDNAIEVLKRTPIVLETLLSGLSDDWIHCNEGPDTWSPFQVAGHLIVIEETNFLVRTKEILSNQEPMLLSRISMTSHLERFEGVSIEKQLILFKELRAQNLASLSSLSISNEDLSRTARHPEVGTVQLYNVLSTWVAHDLIHIGQITRVMAKQYKSEVGPFIEFLTRLQ